MNPKHVRHFEQYKHFVLFLVAMAGGCPNAVDEQLIERCHDDFWNPLETAREVMQAITNDEYLKNVKQKPQVPREG